MKQENQHLDRQLRAGPPIPCNTMSDMSFILAALNLIGFAFCLLSKVCNLQLEYVWLLDSSQQQIEFNLNFSSQEPLFLTNLLLRESF